MKLTIVKGVTGHLFDDGYFLPMLAGGQETPSERIEREVRELFPYGADKIDAAASAFNAGRVKLFRADGVTPIYAEAGHKERLDGLLGDLDHQLGLVTKYADEEVARAEAELVKMAAVDPLDTLKPDQQARAASRAVFVREDAERLPYDRIAASVAAVVASDDRPLMALWLRYGTARLEAATEKGEPSTPARRAASEALRDLAARLLGDPAARREKRQTIERRAERAKFLGHQATQARRNADGTTAAREAAIRRGYAGSF